MRCLLTASCSLREFDFVRSGGSLGRQISYCEKKQFRIIVLTILSGLNLTLVFLNLKRGPVLRALGPDFQYWGLEKEQQSLWSQHSPDQRHCPLRTWPKPQNKLNKLLIFQKVVELSKQIQADDGDVEDCAADVTRRSSASKIRVLLAGTRFGTPLDPYAKSGGMTMRRRPAFFIPSIPSSQPCAYSEEEERDDEVIT